MKIPDKLYADEISYKLPTQMIGKRLYSYETLDSTNDAAWKLGEEGERWRGGGGARGATGTAR